MQTSLPNMPLQFSVILSVFQLGVCLPFILLILIYFLYRV